MAGSPNTATSDPGQGRGWTPLMRAAEAGDINSLNELLADSFDIYIDSRDYDGCTSLALAAQKGHAAVVERLLLHGADPNLSDMDQVTPLWKAARYGHTSVVRLLLSSTKLSDVNPRPSYIHEHRMDTPLSIALKEGHQETAELLSSANGINPCLTTTIPGALEPEEMRVLGLAIRTAFEDVALALLDKCNLGHHAKIAEHGVGAEGESKTTDRIEPTSKLLVFAIAAGCSTIIQELLTKYGADANAVHEYYAKEERAWVIDSPLMAASRRGDLRIVRLLLDMDEIRPVVSSKHSGTAIIAAAQGGFVDIVKTLITDGRIEVGHTNGYGRDALSFAAESGSEAVVNELLATESADPNCRDFMDKTPLIWAAYPRRGYGGYGPGGWQSYEGVICRLLAHDQIDINARDCSGRTALSYAVKNGALGLVMALLEHPQIDLTVGPGYRSLLVDAALRGHTDVAQALLSAAQLDVNTIPGSEYQRTALMDVVEYGRVENETATQVLLSTPVSMRISRTVEGPPL